MAWAGKAPLVVKLRCAAGGKIGTKPVSGRVYAGYIATREGVAQVETEAMADPMVYAEYAAERPGSTGLFGVDSAAPPDLGDVQAALSAAPWWQEWVVSMRAPDADAVGMGTPQDWRAMVRQAMPQVAREHGVAPESVRWAAAVHWKKGQPHVHVLVWPVGADAPVGPRLLPDRLRAAKKVFAREVFGQQRAGLAAQKTAQRDAVLRGVAAALVTHREASAAIEQRLARLGTGMPKRGRVALAYMPAPVRQEARDLADLLLRQAPLAAGAAAVERAARELAEQRAGSIEGVAAGKRARADLRDRVAQVILRTAAGKGAPEAGGEAGGPKAEPIGEVSPAEAEPEGEVEWESGEEPPHGPEVEPVGEVSPAGLQAPRRSREEWAALRAEMRRRDPASALALAAGVPALAATQHATLTAAMRQVEVVRGEVAGREGKPRMVLSASGPAADKALAILGLDAKTHQETLAWQCARLQGLRFNDEPPPPTPADALAAAVKVELTEQQRTEWTGLLRAAEAHRDPATGRIEAPAEKVAAILAAVKETGGEAGEAEVVIQAYRQREADWREERRGLSADEALRRCGVVATREDLLAVALRRDPKTQAMRAEGHEALLQALPATDRAMAEKEIVRQAVAAQKAMGRGKAAAETDPARALATMLGAQLPPEDAQRLRTLLRRCEVRLDEAGQWPVAEGAAFTDAVVLVQGAVSEYCLFDVGGEVARAAARVQGLWADQQGGAVDTLAAVSGREADAVRAALRGLPGGSAEELARRLGVKPSEALTQALARVPAWLMEPERSPAAQLLARLGIDATPEAEAEWTGRLRSVQVYRDGAGTLAAGGALAGVVDSVLPPPPAPFSAQPPSPLDQQTVDLAALGIGSGVNFNRPPELSPQVDLTGDRAREEAAARVEHARAVRAWDAGKTEAQGAILAAAWRQDRAALFDARREAWAAPGKVPGGVREVRALAAWAGRPVLDAREVQRWDRALALAVQGRAGAEDALVRLMSPRPEAEERVRAEVRAVIEAQRLRQMRPVDALAARLGATWEDRTRHEVDRLLRRLSLDGRHAEAWARAVARVAALAPDATRREVRRAVAWEAARAQRTPIRVRRSGGLLQAVLDEIERAKAEAEFATTREGMSL